MAKVESLYSSSIWLYSTWFGGGGHNDYLRIGVLHLVARRATSERLDDDCENASKPAPTEQQASESADQRSICSTRKERGVKDISVRLQNRPGTVAGAAAALHRAGLAVTGVCGCAVDGRGLRHFLVEDGECRDILQEAGAELVEERDVLVMPLDPRPGWLVNFTLRLGEAGVNIEVTYRAVDNHLAVVPNDIAKAQAALAS